MRIGIIALLHESNTFSSIPTTLEKFEQQMLLEGPAIRAAMEDAHHEVGGFFAGLEAMARERQIEIEAVPLFAARALPAGPVTAATFAELVTRLTSAVRAAGELDGLLVAPHGATVSQKHPDADGYWLRELRELVGDETPVVGTLDAHANLSETMAQSCEALVVYRTNPHIDQRQRGMEAARLLVRTVLEEIQPTMSTVMLPLVINIDRQCTAEPHLQPIYQLADQQLEHAEVLSNSIVLGFPYADVPEMGTSVVVVTNDNQALADRLARELAARIWQDRAAMRGQLTSIDDALGQLERLGDGPVCLLDMGDNVGGGSAADGTSLAAALLARSPGPAFICLFDPTAVAACTEAGAGQQLQLRIGAHTDSLHGDPLLVDASVLSLHDGRFREDQPRHGGFTHFDQGPTAVIRTGRDLTIMLTSRRMVPFSLQQLISCGLDPASFRVLVAKGVNAPIAAYREVCRHLLRVDTPGCTTANLDRLTYHNRRQPMWPFEEDCEWSGETAST